MTPYVNIPLLIHATPIGEENALPSKAIWNAVDCWSLVTVRHYLNELAIAGKVRRRLVAFYSQQRWVYWREASSA